MANYKEFVPLHGSERAPLIGAQTVGAAKSDEIIRVTILLRSRADVETAKAGNSKVDSGTTERSAEKSRVPQRHLTHQEFFDTYGANNEDLEKIEEFAHEYNLSIAEVSLAKRSVALTGTVANFGKEFQVEVRQYEHLGQSYRGRNGPIHVPTELNTVVKAVMGLDNRPQARAHFRTHPTPSRMHVRTTQPAGTFTPAQVAAIYGFPAQADGNGQCIALVELGGGFKSQDISYYFRSVLKLPVPKIVAVSVDGASNAPAGSANSPDGEVMLDIEGVGAVAPKAMIAVYFAPNTDQGFYNAIAAALHDTRYKPAVISISWGSAESAWTQQSLTAYSNLLQNAATLGVTVCIASGDNGSADGVNDGLQHVDFPASSPFALACGGTTLTAANSELSHEVVWNEMEKYEGATGGGVSEFFAKPAYQANAGVPPSKNPGNFVGRGVPDVAGNADPATGYDVYVDGQMMVMGGTSAVAPLWAGLLTLVNQMNEKRIGNLNPLLYAQDAAASVFHNVTEGNNGAYSAGPGWSACTGWGSPKGVALASLLGATGSKG